MSSGLKPHQQRVVDEADELRTKIEKLGQFTNGKVFAELDDAERSRLLRQYAVMRDYLSILDERISCFT